MALKTFLSDKHLKDLNGDTLMTTFQKAGFEKDNAICSKILKDDLGAAFILETSESDLIEEFNLKDSEDKNKFLKMRAIIRKTFVLQKERIPTSRLKKQEVEKFTKYDIYQLLENEIESNDDSQSQHWFSFIEKEGMNGTSFVAYEERDLVRELKLTKCQKISLGKLLEKINPPLQSGQQIIAKNGAFGVIGAAKVSVGGNMKVFHGNRKNRDSDSDESL